MPAVEPRPEAPRVVLVLEVLLLDVPDLLDAVFAAAIRSPNRFCVPRNAPRLEVMPGAADEADCPLSAVLVLVAVADEESVLDEPVEEVDAGEDDVLLELGEVVDDEEVDEPPDAPPPPPPCPPVNLRFPRSAGARSDANRSA